MNYNIILLDTDAKHANQIKDHLKGYSEYTIYVFTDVAACLVELKKINPAVIFLDAELKHDAATLKTETELMLQLKTLSPHSEIILYSGEEKLEIMIDQVKQGAHGFALKSTHTNIKAETLLLSAIRHYKLNKDIRFYKKLTIGLVILMIIVAALIIGAYELNLITDEVQGPLDY